MNKTRSKTTNLNRSKNRRLTSVNLTNEMFDYIDKLAENAGLSRSALIELILDDFKSNNRSLTITITADQK